MGYNDTLNNRSVRKSLLLTAEINADLERVSKEKHLSQNEIVIRAVTSYLKKFSK